MRWYRMSSADRKRRLQVMLPYPFPGPFDYAVPPDLAPQPGDIVLVPLNRREEVGVVWDEATPPAGAASTQSSAGSGRHVPDHRLKPLLAVLDAPPLPAPLRRFIDWVAGYTLSPPGEVMAMALRINALRPERAVTGLQLVASPPEGIRLTEARRQVMALLADGTPITSQAVREHLPEISSAVLRNMVSQGLLEQVPMVRPSRYGVPEPAFTVPDLSADQAEVAESLREAVRAHTFSVTLLEGVTGSGKTEVYLEAIAEALTCGRQTLILLPEIALSTQWLDRFRRRFGVEPAIWHSDLSSLTRRQCWRAVTSGEAKVVVGARSALFLPFSNLGLVVVDEEHETAFKQEDGIIYHARDMAVVRARFEQAASLLVSATPSLETLANVESGRYRRLSLRARHGVARLPSVTAIDLRSHPPERNHFLSPPLVTAIRQAFERGEQAMLFLNRRGYAPLTLCRACGTRMQCPHCTAWLVEHRLRRQLICHHCGHEEPVPLSCPSCGAEHALTAIGPGVERITEEAATLFPGARVLVMASDTLPGPAAAAEAAGRVAAREVDLLIGTQIVAKGWNFPHLTCVGVVDADLGLGGGDLRASERTVQLLHQVAGRAGRAEAPGHVFLQSWNPDHPAIQALLNNDFAAFMEGESEIRRVGYWPPHGRLAALIVSADDAATADRLALDLARNAPDGDGIWVLGPAPAPLAVLRGRHRRRLLLRTRRNIAVQPILRRWLQEMTVPRGARIEIDVDPVSFL
ncbi:Primosomal protein N' [Granulibacter bethesdensis CGDNIH4]|nr:Primosomal protein N' [Granulibacter bethesdensis CGDNIH4]